MVPMASSVCPHHECRYIYTDTNCDPARRNSTILNPRSYVADELSKQAPIFVGSTKFDALEDVKNILVTGGAGFMYASRAASVWTLLAARCSHIHRMRANATQRLLVCASSGPYLPALQRYLIRQA